MEIYMKQLTFATAFSTQQPSSTVIKSEPIPQQQNVVASKKTRGWDSIVAEIEEKQDRIFEIRRETGLYGEEIQNTEEECGEELDEDEEVIFDESVPDIEVDGKYTSSGCESEIKMLEDEITELERELKR